MVGGQADEDQRRRPRDGYETEAEEEHELGDGDPESGQKDPKSTNREILCLFILGHLGRLSL